MVSKTSLEAADWDQLSQEYAFIGNSLLRPMSQTSSIGLNPLFWFAFPNFGDQGIEEEADQLGEYVTSLLAASGASKDIGEWLSAAEDLPNLPPIDKNVEARAVQAVSIEYTKLFIGPPQPAAAPWETMHRGGGKATAGFGQATVEMRNLLREAGLGIQNENNQYADHMGIELLYLSELCRRVCSVDENSDDISVGDDETDIQDPQTVAHDQTMIAQICDFIQKHPLAWIDSLLAKVDDAAPRGYFSHLLGVEKALLLWHNDVLSQ